jgi:hypothetical protein
MTTGTSGSGEVNRWTDAARGARRRSGLALRLLSLMGAMLAGGCSAEGVRAVAAPAAAEVVVAPPPPVSAMGDESFTAGAPPSASPQSRPGLGTEWGEERVSPIEDVPFRRADESRPIAATDLRYDDERGVLALAAHVADRAPRGHESSAAGGAISIWLKDGHDTPLDVVQIAGQTFVVGEAGERYTIVLENHSGHRFEAVSTVDGLDVINGKPGSVRNRGYLLMPYATLEIDGFRQTEQTVAAFRFGRVADSYAAKVGTARDVGVIGIAFFSERGDGWVPTSDDEVRRRESATPFPGDGRFATPPRW